ncbi:MAG: lipoprotein signal peptidase [Gammaproteobacteria bacterium]|nr:lipoprotein signal peptidase [Gammaproteobacteria bacterium]
MLRWLWLSLVVVVLDQVSKQLIVSSFMLYEVLELLPLFNLTLAYNEGAAFSFLSDQSGWQRWFLSGVAAVATLVMVLWLRGLKQHERLSAIALALIVGGAVGNLIDRLLFGYVIDFLDFYIGQYHWPAFNVADSAISIGVAILLYEILFSGDEHKAAD